MCFKTGVYLVNDLVIFINIYSIVQYTDPNQSQIKNKMYQGISHFQDKAKFAYFRVPL